MTINERIKYIRKGLKYSQKIFAEQLEINQSALSQIEKGLIMPSLTIIKKIISKYNITYEWLIDGTDKNRDTNNDSDEMLVIIGDKALNQVGGNVNIGNKEVDKKKSDNSNEDNSLRNENTSLKKEVQMLKEMIASKDKIISLLERQIK